MNVVCIKPQYLHRCSQRKSPARKCSFEGGLSQNVGQTSFSHNPCTDLQKQSRNLQRFFFCRVSKERKSIEKSRVFVILYSLLWSCVYGRRIKIGVFCKNPVPFIFSYLKTAAKYGIINHCKFYERRRTNGRKKEEI